MIFYTLGDPNGQPPSQRYIASIKVRQNQPWFLEQLPPGQINHSLVVVTSGNGKECVYQSQSKCEQYRSSSAQEAVTRAVQCGLNATYFLTRFSGYLRVLFYLLN